MKISVQEVVESLAKLVGEPFDIPTQEQLKHIVGYKMADFFQKVVAADPNNRRFYLKEITVPLERVDRALCPVDTDCTVLRTTLQIPIPARTAYALFDYVGPVTKDDGYRYIPPEQLQYIINYGSKYTQDRPGYFYVNKYVYIYNEYALEDINIRGLWFDQRQLNIFKCEDQPCYKDTDQYDIPDDIVNLMIQDILKNEIKLLIGEDKTEVTLDKTNGN
jgi:hypothetical protein